MTTSDNIVRVATEPSLSWTNKQTLQFHYFNPNGVYTQKKALDNKISELVEQGKCKSGAIIAYGSLNLYYPNKMRELLNNKRVSSDALRCVIWGYKRDIESAENFINETSGK